jgi:hypothetical protein
MKRIGGFDLSMTASGVCVIESRTAEPLWAEDDAWAVPVLSIIGEAGKASDSARVRAKRAEKLAQAIAARAGRLDLAVFEGGSFGSKRFARNLADERTAMRIRLIGLMDCPVAVVQPSTLKLYATGDGHASKESVVEDTLASYELPSRDDNLIDAFVLARMGARRLGQPIEAQTEEHQLRAMRTPKWEA